MSKIFNFGNEDNPIDLGLQHGGIIDKNGIKGTSEHVLSADGDGHIEWRPIEKDLNNNSIILYFKENDKIPSLSKLYIDKERTILYTKEDFLKIEEKDYNKIIIIDENNIIYYAYSYNSGSLNSALMFTTLNAYFDTILVVITSNNIMVSKNSRPGNYEEKSYKQNVIDNTNKTSSIYYPTINAITTYVNNVTHSIWKEVTRFDTAGVYTWSPSETGTYGFLVVGAGGGGCEIPTYTNNGSIYYFIGGTSGDVTSKIININNINTNFNLKIGAKGIIGNDGESSDLTSDLLTVSVNGGLHGEKEIVNENNIYYSTISVGNENIPAVCMGGQPGLYGRKNVQYISSERYRYPNTDKDSSSYNHSTGWYKNAEQAIKAISQSKIIGAPWKCINPFTQEDILGGGGGAYIYTPYRVPVVREQYPGGKNSITGLGGGDYKEDASEFGCGGGAGANGADGAIIIYKAITSI